MGLTCLLARQTLMMMLSSLPLVRLFSLPSPRNFRRNPSAARLPTIIPAHPLLAPTNATHVPSVLRRRRHYYETHPLSRSTVSSAKIIGGPSLYINSGATLQLSCLVNDETLGRSKDYIAGLSNDYLFWQFNGEVGAHHSHPSPYPLTLMLAHTFARYHSKVLLAKYTTVHGAERRTQRP